jgi:hypothetical protein
MIQSLLQRQTRAIVRSPVPRDAFPGRHSSGISTALPGCSTQAGALLGRHPSGSPSYPVNLAPLNPLFWGMPNRSVASPQTQILGGMSHTPSQSGTHPHLAQSSVPLLAGFPAQLVFDGAYTCGSSKLRARTKSTTWTCAYAARFPLRFSDIVRFLGWVISNIHS